MSKFTWLFALIFVAAFMEPVPGTSATAGDPQGDPRVAPEVEIELLGSCLWTKTTHVAIDSPYAYCAVPYGLMILDVGVSTAPEYLSRIYLPGAYDVTLAGDYAYVACGHDQGGFAELRGMKIVDVSDPANPQLVFEWDAEDRVRAVTVDDHFAFVCNDTVGLVVFDIADPTAPVQVGHYRYFGNALDVVISGGYAFVANLINLLVLDVSDVTQPYFVTLLPMMDIAERIEREGSYVYLVDTFGGLAIVDISTPTSPVEIGRFATPGTRVSDVVVRNGTAYLTSADSTLLVVDVSAPQQPSILGVYDSPMPYPTNSGLDVDGDFAYVADSSGLRIIDVSDPTAPDEVGFYHFRGPPWQVAVRGDYAYVANRSGLEVVDISAPLDPVQVGYHWTIDKAHDVATQGGLALIAGAFAGVHFFDVSDPQSPVELAIYDTPGHAWGVAISDTLAFVADDDSLLILNAADPAHPTGIASLYMPATHAHNVVVRDTLAYVGDYGSGVHVIDISDPSAPRPVSVIKYGSCRMMNLDVAGDYLYVPVSYAFSCQHLQIFDVSDPLNPAVASELYLPSSPNGVMVYGDYAFVATTRQGVYAVNVANPNAPYIAGHYFTPGISYGVWADSSRIYVADSFGLLALSYSRRGYTCGDANADGEITSSDAIYLVNYVFKSGPPPAITGTGDPNCDGMITAADVIYIIAYAFKGGPAPCCP
jgi:hypothetical protein